MRNDIARIEIADEHSAGAVALLDERWKRRRVGIVWSDRRRRSQPLLAPSYYLDKALAPFADVREPRPATAIRFSPLGERPNVMVLADGMVAPGRP